MNSISRLSARWWLILCVLGLWTVLLTQACDRNAKRSDTNGEVTEPDSKQEKADQAAGAAVGVSGGELLPGETKPGTVEPEALGGPKAPAVFFLASLKGYLEPCGCSAEVLLGGIDRIVGYYKTASELYADSTMLDTGDMLFEFDEIEEHAVPQEKAKADVITMAMKELGTRITVPGERDFGLGTKYYLGKMEEMGVQPIAANLKIDGKALPASQIIELDDIKLGVIGAVDPELYKEVEGVETSDAAPAVAEAAKELKEEGAQTLLLLMHGELGPTREVLQKVDGLDFGVVGHGPRETDQVYDVDGAHTLEAFDQGRYMGVLKLFQRDKGSTYANAGAASQTEIEKVAKLIEHKKEQLQRFPPSKRRENPPILKRLEESIAKLEQRKKELEQATVELPVEGNAFIYRPVPMEPGLPISEKLQDRRTEYNASLKQLQSQVEREIPPVEEGQAFFVGNQECARCHVAEQDFWKKTQHAHAVETLEKRNKLFDQSCIGCHVVGYEKPGGSVIGKLHYEAELGSRTIEKNLEDVGCETCHGPGSNHAVNPIDTSGNPHNIVRNPGKEECMQCHVPEHSPSFNFDAYVKDVTGEGHPMDSK